MREEVKREEEMQEEVKTRTMIMRIGKQQTCGFLTLKRL